MNQQQAYPEASEVRRTTLAWVGRIAGPALAWLVYQLLPNSLDSAVLVPHAARATAAIGVWMAVWWMTEALPLPVTSLLPIVLFPLVGVFSSQARPGDIVIDEVTSQFGRVVSLQDEIATVEFADDEGRLATRTLPLKQLARHPRQTAITQAAAPYANPYIFLFMGAS